MASKIKKDRLQVSYSKDAGLVGTVSNQVSKLRNTLKRAKPPAREDDIASYLHRREITELIGELHLYLSEF